METKEIRVFLDEDEHARFKSKVAKEKDTMQGKMYEWIIKYILEGD